MKQTGMLVVSLREVNFGFWSRLGCSGQSANVLSRQGLKSILAEIKGEDIDTTSESDNDEDELEIL